MHLSVEGKTLYDEEGPPPWPLAPYTMILNMVLDSASMLPQMHLIKHAEDVAPPLATNFIGLLGVSRVFRLLFWAGTIAQHYWEFGSVPEEFPSLVPDLVGVWSLSLVGGDCGPISYYVGCGRYAVVVFGIVCVVCALLRVICCNGACRAAL